MFGNRLELDNVYSPGQKHIPYACALEAKDTARPRPLDNLPIQEVQETPDQLLLRRRDIPPQLAPRLDDIEPLQARTLRIRRQAMVEERLDRAPLERIPRIVIVIIVVVVVRDEAHKPA